MSGFWHIAREPSEHNPQQLFEKFLPDCDFIQIYRLYIFDKKLRLLLLDIIERFEVHFRTVLAHEMSRTNPLAYLDKQVINPKFEDRYAQWQQKLKEKINASRDDFVLWHKQENKPLPFWAVVETWDFGMLSKYFSMLKRRHQNEIAKRFNVDNTAVLINWLNEINIVRNQSAHHSRIWNRKGNPIKILDNVFFNQWNLSEESRKRLSPRMLVLWYLISQTSENYQWLDKVHNLIKEEFPMVPNAKLKSMGIIENLS